MKIGIVGLGLIGGSMAKALSAKHTIYGADLRQDVMEEALNSHVLAAALDEKTIGTCELILLGLFPQRAVDYVREHAERFQKGAIVVDLCGVKRVVEAGILPVAEAHGFHYIGGHPMAGLARVGWEYSRGDLFQNASMILVPHSDTAPEVLETVRRVVMDAGFGNIAISTAEEHDYMIAYTSQLAHVLSSAYVKTPAAQRHRGFSAGSFRDMTRVAWLNEDMWTELFLDNPDYLAEEVEGLAARLLEYAMAIRGGDSEGLRRLLREGRERKEALEDRE